MVLVVIEVMVVSLLSLLSLLLQMLLSSNDSACTHVLSLLLLLNMSCSQVSIAKKDKSGNRKTGMTAALSNLA